MSSKFPALSNASSQYGTSMGRQDTHGEYDLAHNFQIQKLAWVDGDYDTGGAYWGQTAGENIYRCIADGYDGDPVEHFIRAASVEDAMDVLTSQYAYGTTFEILPDELGETEPDGKLYWGSTSSGLIEIQLTMEDAESMSHSGQCDSDVATGRQKAYIAAQLETISPDDARAELKDYGCWDEEELANHDANLTRILFLAAGNIVDNGADQDEEDNENESETL